MRYDSALRRHSVCSAAALLASMLIGFVGTAWSQQPNRAREIGSCDINTNVTVKDLVEHYTKGEWDDLQNKLLSVLQGCTPQTLSGQKSGTLDPTKHYYSVLFINSEARPDPAPVRVMVHFPKPDPYSTVLPGVKSLYQVFLAGEGQWTLQSAITETRAANPTTALLPKFVAGIAPPMFGGLKGLPAAPRLRAHVSLISLAFKRSTVEFKDAVTPAPDLCDSSVNANTAQKLNQEAKGRLGPLSGCAMSVADGLTAVLSNANICPPVGACCPSPPPHRCGATNSLKEVRCRLLDGLAAAYGMILATPICQAAANASDSATQREAVTKTYELFTEALAEGKNLTGQTTYTNLPTTRFSLGLITAGVLSNELAQRVKVENSLYADDSVRGALTQAVVNWYPSPYDSSSPSMTKGEIFRGFLGAVLTPEFGMSLGVGVGVTKGLSINAGYAWMLVNTPKGDKKIGEAPANPQDPYERSVAGVWFAGFGFAFQ